MIDVELLGFVYHYGLDVNGITVIRECPVGVTGELFCQLIGLYLDPKKCFVHLFQSIYIYVKPMGPIATLSVVT